MVFYTSTHKEVWKIESCRNPGFHGQYWTWLGKNCISIHLEWIYVYPFGRDVDQADFWTNSEFINSYVSYFTLSNYKGKKVCSLQYSSDTTNYKKYKKYKKISKTTYNSGCLLFWLYKARHMSIYPLQKYAWSVKHVSFNTYLLILLQSPSFYVKNMCVMQNNICPGRFLFDVVRVKGVTVPLWINFNKL